MSKKNQILKFIYENRNALNRIEGIELHEDHGLPRSRRDFLSTGLYSAAFGAILPSTASLLMSTKASAEGLECPAKVASKGVPFLQFHKAGGGRTTGYGLARGNKGTGPELEAEYTSTTGNSADTNLFVAGVAPDTHPSKNGYEYVKFCGHYMPKWGYIYQSAYDYFNPMGTEKMTEISQKVQIISFLHRSPDDNSATMQNFMPVVRALRGDSDFNVLSASEGTMRSGLGAVSAFSVTEASKVLRGTDISGLIDVGLKGEQAVTQSFLQELSSYLSSNLASEDAKKILGCSSKAASEKILQFASGFDLNADENYSAVFSDNDQNLGALCHMLKEGLCLTSGRTFGGYDYHNGTSSGYFTNREGSQPSGWRAVDYFLRSGTPAVMLWTSDGSTRCANAQEMVDVNIDGETVNMPLAVNSGDFGRGGCSYLVVVKGDKDIGLKHAQVGHGEAGGGVAREGNPIGYDQGVCASVILETIRRLMVVLAEPGNVPTATFQDITAGLRFDDNLESYMPIKKV